MAGILLACFFAAPAFSDDAVDVPASALKGKRLAFVACSDLNRACRSLRKTLLDALQAKGVLVTDLQDPFDPVLQAQHLDQAIAQKPDLIVIAASNARSIIPALRRAKAVGIPVINLIQPMVPESEPYFTASIENNPRELGEFAGMNIVEGLQKEGLDKANVIVITGAQAQPEVALRMEAFYSVLAKYPQYKIVDVQDGNWDQGKSAEIARTLFAKYAANGGVQAAFGMADHQAAAIIQAAQQAGMPVELDNKGLIVTGSNCFEIGIVNISNGLQYGTSTQAMVPTALFAAPLIEQALVGKTIPKRTLYKESRITRDNVDKWKAFCSGA